MPGRKPRSIPVEPLTREAFEPFGEVVDWRSALPVEANAGTAQKFSDLASIEIDAAGRPSLSLYRAQPRHFPLRLEVLEHHPLASQAFVPLATRRFLIVVADGSDVAPALASCRAFLAEGGMGVNFKPGTWHHPLLALDEVCDFLVVDRRFEPQCPRENLVEFPLEGELMIESAELSKGLA